MNWLRAFLSVPLMGLAVLVQVFRTNRHWLEYRLSQRHAAAALKGLFLVTLVVWVGIWFFANETDRTSLNQVLSGWWAEIAR